MDLHFQAGNDELTKSWIKREIKDILIRSESIADYIYEKKAWRMEDLMKSVKYPNRITNEQKMYYEKHLRDSILKGAEKVTDEVSSQRYRSLKE